MIYAVFKKSIALFCIALLPHAGFSAVITSTAAGGDWTLGSTWVGGVAPANGTTDDVVIATTGTGVVTLSGNRQCRSLTVNANSRLTISGVAVTLTINAAFFNFPASTNNGTIDGTGILTIGAFAATFTNNITGVINLGSYSSTIFPTTNNGSFTTTTDINCTGVAFNNALSSSVLTIGGTYNFTTLTATTAGNTVIYNGAAQNVYGTTYSNLTLSGSGTKTLTTANAVIGGNLIIAGTASLDVNNRDISVGRDWTVTSTAGDPFVQGTRTVTFNGTGIQNISTVLAGGETFYNLTVNSTGPLAFGSSTDVTVTNTLTMTAGLVNVNGRTFTLGASGAASTLTYTAGWFYGGTFKRFWPNTTTITNANYGLFPMGSENASTYRPVKITSSAPTTATGFFTVYHVDAITTTDLSPVYNDAGTNILRKSDAQFQTAISGVTGGGNWTIAVTMTGFNATGNIADMRLAVSTGVSTASAVGTHVATIGTQQNPTASRNLITVLTDFNNDFRVSSTNITNTPLRMVYYSRNGGGNWNAAATWSTAACNGAAAVTAPAVGDDVQICSGDIVTVNVASTINSVSVKSGGTLNGASNLNVTTDMAVAGTGVITNTGGIWTVSRDLTLIGTGSSSAATLNISGDLIVESGTTLTINTASSVSGDLTVNGTLALGTNNLAFNGSAKNLKGGGSITGSGASTINVTNSKAILSGTNITIAPVVALAAATTVTNSGVVTLSGNLTGANAASSVWTNAAGSTLNAGGTLLATGTLNASSANNLVNYNGGAAQTVKGTTYADLSISNANVKTLGAATVVYETLAISGTATLASDIYQITGNLTNPMTMAAGTTLTLGNTGSAAAIIFPTNYSSANITLDAASTVIYQSTGAQIVSSVPTYGNLTAQTSGTKTVSGNISVNGNLAIAGTATLASDVYQITGTAAKTMTMAAGTTLTLGNTGSATAVLFPANFTNPNITLNATSNVIYQSTGAQTISSVPTYGGLSVQTSGIKTLSGATTVNGALAIGGTATLASDVYQITGNATYAMTMAAGTTLTLGNTGSATAVLFPTNFTNPNITLNASSTVNYQANTAQTVSGVPAYGNLSLSTSGTKTLDAAATVNGNLTIQGTAVFSLSTFDVGLKGNWSNTSTNADPLVEGNQTVTFNSTTAAQTISNTGNANGTVFYGLTFNNTFGTAPQITASANVTVSNTLTMTSGRINLSGTTFTLGTAGVASSLARTASTTTNWFYGGTLTRNWLNATAITSTSGNYYGLFPVGESTASSYSPLEINTTANPTANGTFSVLYTPAPNTATDLSPVYNDAGTNIERIHNSSFVTSVSGVTGGAYDISVTMTGLNSTVGVLSDVRLAIFTGGTTASAVGTHAAATGTIDNPTAKRTGLAIADLTTKDFRVASANKTATPLPVEFLSFNAKPNGEVVEVTWSTAVEMNTDHFMVQRSQDGKDFRDVEKVDAAGNSSTVKKYSSVDPDPYPGVSYYRLKQVDNDGKFAFSDMVAVNFNGDNSFTVYPSPSSGEFNVSIIGGKGKEVHLTIHDVLGRESYSSDLHPDKDNYTQAIDLSGKLSPGVYMLTYSTGSSCQTQKLVIR